MRLQTVLIATSLSITLLCSAPGAQSACCSAEPKPGVAAENKAESLVKDLTALTAKIRSLPKEERTAAVASLKAASEACPIGRASLQVVTVLKLASDGMDASGCCADAKDEAGKASVAKIKELRTVLAAHVALLDELGLPRLAPDCCVKDAGAKAGEAAACEGQEKRGCCEAGGVAKFAACAKAIEKTCNEMPAKVAALDAKAKEKSAAGATALGNLGLAPVMFSALSFYADGLTAAAKDCGDAPEGAVVKGLAAMTTSFVKNSKSPAAAGCCSEKSEKKESGCCSEKTEKAGAACCSEKTEKKESGCCSEKAVEKKDLK